MSKTILAPCVNFITICLLATLIITPLTVYMNTASRDDMKQNSIMDKLRSFVQVRTLDEAHHFQKRSRNSNNNTTKKPSAHEIACRKWKTCEECVSITSGNYQCLWCKKGDKCSHYPYKHIVPQSSECDWENARWGVCWVDFRAMVITVSIIGAVLLIAICCCIVKFCRCLTDVFHVTKYCCCCECFADSRSSRKEEKALKRLERKLEIQARRQEMMIRYGTQRPGGVPYGSTGNYTQFENTPI